MAKRFRDYTEKTTLVDNDIFLRSGLTGSVSNYVQASTIANYVVGTSAFGNASRSAALTGFAATNSAITATDNILSAFGKSQGQINANISAIATNTSAISAIGGRNAANGYVGLNALSGVSIAGQLSAGSALINGAAPVLASDKNINGGVVGIASDGTVSISGFTTLSAGMRVSDSPILLRGPSDGNHYIIYGLSANALGGWTGIDGITLAGFNQGCLGITNGSKKQILKWDTNGITVTGSQSVSGDITLSGATTSKIVFAEGLKNKKIVMFDDDNNNEFQFYGFGISAGKLRAHVTSTADNFGFFAGASSSAANEVFSILGAGGARLHDNPVYLRGGSDVNHYLTFGNIGSGASAWGADGPILAGWTKGVLGMTSVNATVGTNGKYPVLTWDYSRVTICTGKLLTLNNTADTFGVSLRAGTLTKNTTYTFPDDGTNGQVLTTNGSGVLSWTAAGSSPSYLTQTMLNLGSVLGSGQKTTLESGTTSSTVFYDSTAPVNGKFYQLAHGSGNFALTQYSDDLVTKKILLASFSDATDINRTSILMGGYRLICPNIINLGNTNNGNFASAVNTLVSSNIGVHYVLDNLHASATAGSKCYDIYLDNSGQLNFNRINDARNAVTETVMKFLPFDATTTNVIFNGKITTAGVNSLGVIGGTHLLLESADAYTGLRNSSAATDLKQWSCNANSDGSFDIAAYNDSFSNKVFAIKFERSTTGGTSSITAVRRAGGGASFDTTSDLRLKVKNSIKEIDAKKSLDIINSISVVNYKYTKEYRDRNGFPDESRIGTVAQWLQDICPEAVINGEELSINYDPLVWHAINSIKALRAEIESLKKRLH